MGWDSSEVLDLHETSFQCTSVLLPLGIVLKHQDVSDHQDVTYNGEATWGSAKGLLSGTFPWCGCIRSYLPSRETTPPDILSVRSLMWSMVWQLLLQVLWWPAFQSDLASVHQQSWNAYSGLMELSGVCDRCHQTSTPTVRFCAVLGSFLDHHSQCAERAVASAMSPCLFGGLCKPNFVAAGDTVIYLFFGWTLRFQLPAESSHWTRGEGTDTVTLSSSVCRELSLPLYIFLAPVALVLCHICLCCWSSDHRNPWREGDLSAQLYKTLCCIRHPKIVPTCFLVTPGGMRHHQWGIVRLKAWTKSGAEEAEFPESKAATRKVSLL